MIQLEGEAHTREILRIDSLTKDNAVTYGVLNPFQTGLRIRPCAQRSSSR